MRDQAIERLIEALMGALNDHDPHGVSLLYAPTYNGIDVGQPGAEDGRAAVERTFARLLRAFPDAVFTGDSIVEGERVALAWTLRGTHLAPFLNVPATGRTVEFHGVSMLTVADGLIVRGSRIWDVAGFLRSVRLLPELPE
jgi:steroid delta-isomerase-like uncharacterized protein